MEKEFLNHLSGGFTGAGIALWLSNLTNGIYVGKPWNSIGFLTGVVVIGYAVHKWIHWANKI